MKNKNDVRTVLIYTFHLSPLSTLYFTIGFETGKLCLGEAQS